MAKTKQYEFTIDEEIVVSQITHDAVPGFMHPGNFYAKLIEAALVADTNNLDALYLGFPGVIGAVRAWRYGQLSERVNQYLFENGLKKLA